MGIHRNKIRRSKWLSLLALAVFTLLVLLSCGIPALGTDNDQMKETSIALGVQMTSNALRESTLQAAETNSAPPTAAPTVQVDLQSTLNVQLTQIALQASPTPTVVNVSNEPTAAPTSVQAEIPEEIVLQDWKLQNMRKSTNCNGDDRLPCWTGSGYTLMLETTEPILIDENWERPFLVFSHSYTFQANANLHINVAGEWKNLWVYKEGTSHWNEVNYDLSQYKGKEIRLRFLINGPTEISGGVWWKPSKAAPASTWSIQNIRIVPAYSN